MYKALSLLLAIQAVMTLAVSGGFYAAETRPVVVAAASYGGVTAMIVSALLAWRMRRASRAGSGVLGLYVGALERMVFVVAAFVLAFAVLRFPPIPLIAGFVGAEIAYYAVAGLLRRRALD